MAKRIPGGHKNPKGPAHTTVSKARGLEARVAALEAWASTLFNPDTAPKSFEVAWIGLERPDPPGEPQNEDPGPEPRE